MTPVTLTAKQKQDILLPAATRVDDAARLCGGTLDAIDHGTAHLHAAGVRTADLDAAAGLVMEAKRKLQQAHTLIVGVALK